VSTHTCLPPAALAALLTLAGVIAVGGAAGRPLRGNAALAASSSLSPAVAGTLTLVFELQVTYPPTDCPASAPSSLECYVRTGKGIVRGLGSVDESFAYFVDNQPAGCEPDCVRLLLGMARLSVPGKGEIELRVGGAGCTSRIPPPLRAEESFTITGGTGRYVGASGDGTYTDVSHGPPTWRGTDTWTGTLIVPGLDFDLTPPTLTGAANRTIRAPRRLKRVRVVYAVTAQDDVDGALSVTCRPRSGSWFTVGRTTRVRCSATDTSGNESTADFAVTVKRTGR
jgi:HYR domain